jgi:hypothetical protein
MLRERKSTNKKYDKDIACMPYGITTDTYLTGLRLSVCLIFYCDQTAMGTGGICGNAIRHTGTGGILVVFFTCGSLFSQHQRRQPALF